MRERAASRGLDLSFDADLGDLPEEAWRGDLDQLMFRGSSFMEEVVFFHRRTRTVILADLIENFEPEKIGGRGGGWSGWPGPRSPTGKRRSTCG